MAGDRLIQQLNERMGIEGAVRFERGCGDLVKATLTAGGGQVDIYQHGGHVTHFQPAGNTPVLFVSETSRFESGKPIRGGIPVCFPWFAQNPDDPSLPMHGFARDRAWKFRSVEKTPDGAIEIVLVLKWSKATLALWPHQFVLTNTVGLDSTGEVLSLSLAVKHVDKADQSNPPMTYEAALHSYFSVVDISDVSVAGLEGARYVDKTDVFRVKEQSDALLTFNGETDRIYADRQEACCIMDGHREIVVAKTQSANTVVWNPWIEKAKRMSDFGDDDWKKMLCVETANVGENSTTLTSRQGHAMGLTLSCGKVAQRK